MWNVRKCRYKPRLQVAQLTDILTKPLPETPFVHHHKAIMAGRVPCRQMEGSVQIHAKRVQKSNSDGRSSARHP